MVTAQAAGRVLASAGSALACGLAMHTAVNLRFLRTPDPDAAAIDEHVAVLIPARNEAAHIGQTLVSVLAQEGVPHLTVIVLDDGSSDATAAIVQRFADADPRVRLIDGGSAALPEGWLGKPWACARLAHDDDAKAASIVRFVDADVHLQPHAIRALAALLRGRGFALVAPYPRQLAGTWLERLVQPLVTWSWAATMPLRWAETSSRPSLSAANGQLLMLDAEAYGGIGGHAAVRADVLEDIGLMRAVKSAGLTTATVDGSGLAECRMYEGTDQVVDGYAKSLWSAFGGPVGSVGANAALTLAYLLPPVAALTSRDRGTRIIGVVGAAAGVASRALVARRTGERVLPDVLAHPASIGAFVALNAISWRRHRRGTNSWKGRAVTVGSSA